MDLQRLLIVLQGFVVIALGLVNRAYEDQRIAHFSLHADLALKLKSLVVASESGIRFPLRVLDACHFQKVGGECALETEAAVYRHRFLKVTHGIIRLTYRTLTAAE